ncbi:DNA-binding transcriptional regulator, LysR family [Pseudobutyrivibrio sp. YE44]|uniref:LysR family transcriptional regulator n=1 Tax=Pseudobutyrivibrio sp. YE44 TaxID=1520802 RepID=UPI000888F85C|nr:LysR family transcriptional regulator [Pseudobutyrivibrio sp. YE44]SDB14019.1 DNA-binding transcriptional regulator, LysR family [Pseudobutyrivibrio sp. YE44]
MEIKQLKYFVVSADVGSFSEAATVLYTTQSSVSKVIASLEHELDYTLFKRESKGISLTEQGKVFYQRASGIVSDFDKLETESDMIQKNSVRIGMIHSSWLANSFSEFYELHKDENCCFYIHADGTSSLIERLKLSEDELSFIYVFPDTRPQVEYLIKKYNLRFVKLKTVDGMIYFAPEDGEDITSKQIDFRGDFSGMKFIQSENDEYLRLGNWKTGDGKPIDISKDISVVTNSDYVMHNMLEKNNLANLSGASFKNYDDAHKPGVEIYNEHGQIDFGYVTNMDYTPSPMAREFIDFIRHAIEE